VARHRPEAARWRSAFDATSLLRDRRDDLCRDPDPERRMRWRLDTLADLTGLDRERKRLARGSDRGGSEPGV